MVSVKGSPSVQQISSTNKGLSFSATTIPQFHTKNPSVQHQNPSVSHNPQFHPPQFHTKNPSVPNTPQFHTKTAQFNTPLRQKLCWTEGFWWRTEGCVKLRGVWNWGVLVWNWAGGTEEFLMLKWGIWVLKRCGSCVIIIKYWSLCGTDVLNWGGLCRTEGYSLWSIYY